MRIFCYTPFLRTLNAFFLHNLIMSENKEGTLSSGGQFLSMSFEKLSKPMFNGSIWDKRNLTR